MIWAVPVGIAVVMALPIVQAVRRVSREAAALRRAMASFAELGPAVRELSDEARAAVGRVPELKVRARPTVPPAS